MRKLFTEEQSKFIYEHFLTDSYREIGNNLGVTAQQIAGYIHNQGWLKEYPGIKTSRKNCLRMNRASLYMIIISE